MRSLKGLTVLKAAWQLLAVTILQAHAPKKEREPVEWEGRRWLLGPGMDFNCGGGGTDHVS